MPNPSGCPDKKRGPEKGGRRKAAEAAGISRHQMYQALDIARIPEDEFERLVESEATPTLTELATIGRGKPSELKAAKVKCCPHCGGAVE